MKILVTGAHGFIGRNLCAQLRNIMNGKASNYGNISIDELYEYDADTSIEDFNRFCQDADFIYNLAGVNRPHNVNEFMDGNFGFVSMLLETLKKYGNKCSIMQSSSIQAELDNPYGKSKRAGEDLLFNYSLDTGANVFVYRFQNVFGKWCRPNYNSVIATFCHNIANDLPIQINDSNTILRLIYIDDVVDELIGILSGNHHTHGKYCYVPSEYCKRLGEIADLLYSFVNNRDILQVPDLSDSFTKKLLSTFLTYLPPEKFIYPLKMNIDERGSFTEIIRTLDRGQFSVNISKPGVVKGQHWHNTKYEKFLVVSGEGLIQLRKIGTEDVVSYKVKGDKLEVIEMIPGYTHNLINLSESQDLITLIWCNECFDSNRPDTYYEPV